MMREISFLNDKKETLRGYVHTPKRFNNTAIIVLHGFPGNMDSSISKRIALDFSKQGYLVLRFSFSGSPPSDGKFESKLMSQEVKEIKNAIDFIEDNYDFNKLILIGHSTGAIDASLYAYKDKRISKLVLSGCVSDLKHAARYDFTDEMVKSFWEKGYVKYKNKKYWSYNHKIKKAFYEEFFTLDIPSAMKKWRKPLLVIHGEKDEAIPSYIDPIEMYKQCKCKKKLVIIKDADHSYKGKGQWKKASREIINFIRH